MNDQNPNTMKPGQTPSRLLLRETILATASGGMAVAMSLVLSLITVVRMPQGGSLTPASMLPVIFFSLAFGPLWGIGTCAVYGLLQFAIDPLAISWASLLLDYPIAFGMLGVAGFFAASRGVRLAERNILRRVGLVRLPRIFTAVTAAMLGRMACHTLSGVIFYAQYAEGQNPWIYSLIYNGTYMLPEWILTCVLLLPLAAVLRPRRG
jgi:thiamine transporter